MQIWVVLEQRRAKYRAGAKIHRQCFIRPGKQRFRCGSSYDKRMGIFMGSRVAASGANSSIQYKFDANGNSGNVASDTTASTSLSDAQLYVLATNNAGSAINNGSDQIAAAFIGGGINSTQAAALSTWVNGYMTALSVNVY